MTSFLLHPATVEPCCNSLRVRRRSSIRPLDFLPRVFSDDRPVELEENVIVDDASDILDNNSLTRRSVHAISPPSDAHLAGAAAIRHLYSLPHIDTSLPTSSAVSFSGTLPQSASINGKIALVDDAIATTADQRIHLKRRLFAAFFAYFLCGWGDGSSCSAPYKTLLD
jgi:hypothetical protein